MGRKKKVQEEPTQPKEIKVETPVNSVSYTGVISVSLQKGKKTYFTRQYKNKGRWPLFYFLNCCLRGDYGVADLYRPKYINAFGDVSWVGQQEPNITDEGSIVSIDQYFTEAYRRTVSSYPYLSLPDIEYDIVNKNIGSSMITYKFNIPFSQISDVHHINAFALYAEPVRTGTSGTARNAVDNPCAFFFILDSDGNIKDLIDTKEAQDAEFNDEYNLYIQWTLSISNSQYNKTTPVPQNQAEPTPQLTEPEEPSEPSEEQGE